MLGVKSRESYFLYFLITCGGLKPTQTQISFERQPGELQDQLEIQPCHAKHMHM